MRAQALLGRPVAGLVIGLLLLGSFPMPRAEAPVPERIAWESAPIAIGLTVGSERRVRFPAPVQVGVPASIEHALRAQSLDGTLYLLAQSAFGPTRVVVREMGSGRTYLLDLEAGDGGGASTPVEIFIPDAAAGEGEEEADTQPSSEYGYVTLTRFAAQQLYAPARLLRDLPGVVRVPVRIQEVALFRGDAVVARPLAAFRAGRLYVTAVKLVNRTSKPVTLDPRRLRGDWLAATFQHNRLLALGDEADTTALYLISARPFEASL